MQFNFVVALACSKTNLLYRLFAYFCALADLNFHESKLFTYSLNDNKAKSRVIKITLVCVDVIYSHFRISVNCLNHFYLVSLAQIGQIGLKYVLVIPSSLTLAGFAK